MEALKKIIREIPDFPKPGILFYDLTTLMQNKAAFAQVVNRMSEPYVGQSIDMVVGVEARGFIFAPTLAYKLGAGFVPVRKPKKLPAPAISVTYDLEYGKDTLEMHADGISAGQKVLVVDDLLATGGTARAVTRLVEKLHGEIVGLVFLVELGFLGGREKLASYDVFSLIKY
ncbi:MAG: adenine phosphoribosyltransferase [Acidobacteria bacterium]|nr:adenine phosphoribosyltransferase [Acidobacteriota bacterium]MBI3655228.1 adenine phosphoribosyltransferase [Acidobacteriota bacterium]